MHEMMDSRIWKQRREELLGEAELGHQAKALRSTRKRRDGRSSAPWDLSWRCPRWLSGWIGSGRHRCHLDRPGSSEEATMEKPTWRRSPPLQALLRRVNRTAQTERVNDEH